MKPGATEPWIVGEVVLGSATSKTTGHMSYRATALAERSATTAARCGNPAYRDWHAALVHQPADSPSWFQALRQRGANPAEWDAVAISPDVPEGRPESFREYGTWHVRDFENGHFKMPLTRALPMIWPAIWPLGDLPFAYGRTNEERSRHVLWPYWDAWSWRPFAWGACTGPLAASMLTIVWS
jgi:hypothetical protein